ncbi:MAG: TraB/GumN family protein [Planctomycetota bacterium]
MLRLAAFLLGLPLLLLITACGQHEPGPAVTGGFDASELDHPSFLWRVEKGDVEAWLFGTMHFTDARVKTLSLEVEDALARADAIFTEIEETPALGAKMAQLSRLPAGDTLENHISKELHNKLVSYLKLRGLPGTMVDQFRPWMANLQISQIDAIPFTSQGAKLDVELMHRAQREGLEFGTIETVEEQIASLTAGTEADHAHMLNVTLDKLLEEIGAEKSSIERLLDLYLAGDEVALWDYALSETDLNDPVQAAWMKSLLTDRNLRMASRVHARLKNKPGSKTFFAFGALHFIGPESVGEHLRSLGYSVTRVPHRPRTAGE